ncbi:methyltransferase cognate corrinoid proteins [Thermanaeromonas toyohensis ToBE]|uniref:Methyltransferase cognate corrinoid proteins n=1 Tax=Thermanaeromonas toyohensis ToBE TaxID=698762 RepID=A0A1W1VC15_9FIRM|nr:corrinoid protein [Thermanaeromonas toyohensis]SMB90514.1 methyltransferase cognate corrinoid proteins [Thermanaeromonas toyohensis ToBE]
MRSKKEILQDLKNAVVELDEEKAIQVAREAIAAHIDAYEAIMEGLVAGMDVVGDKYEKGEYFIPEVLLASDAMNAALSILKPYLPKEHTNPYKVVIGVVQGDTHDIGKNIVKIMLEAGGFQVIDLGRDVPLECFIEKAEETGAHIIAMSTLMSTTMDGMKEVIDMLKKQGKRHKYKVMVGGGAISQAFANAIGADGYAPDANAAVRKAKELMEGYSYDL